MRIFLALVTFLIATTAFAQVPLELGDRRKVEPVSIVALLSNPDKYHNKSVRVTGAINFGFEASAICLHSEDLTKVISKNCLWIEPDLQALKTDPATLQQYNGSYVTLECTFDKNQLGHMSAYSGAMVGCWHILLAASSAGG